MKWNTPKLHVTLYLVSFIILLVGFGSAVWIYQTAGDSSNNDLGYEIVGGNVYPTTPSNTKRYSHDLELYGGKAAVLADQLSRWCAALWYGKTLAFTVACIALVLSVGVFLFARYVSSGNNQDDRQENG